jgi:hypothetical protein
MWKGLLSIISIAIVTAMVCLACDGIGGSSSRETRSGLGPRTASTPVFPPLDGPERTFRAEERTDYRELPEFQLPDPDRLPDPSDDEDGAEFRPPESSECPEDWEVLRRPLEGFQVCFPSEWEVDGHGYVSSGADDRWYALGLYRFGEDGHERAHVSIYMTTPYSQPVLYVSECDRAYKVRLDGLAAGLCPDHAGQFPEAKIIAYHVPRGDRDYFLNVVPMMEFDSEAGLYYLDSWSEKDLATGIDIVQSIQFTELPAAP